MVSWTLGLLVALLQFSAPTLYADLDPDEPDAAQYFEYASPWLDEDVEAALATTTAWHTEEAEELITPLLIPHDEPSAPGSFEGLRDDVNTLLQEAAGFDITVIEGLVVAGSEERITAVAMGDIPTPEQFTEVDVAGNSAYKVEIPDVPHMLLAELAPDNLYAFPVDEPHPGLVLTTDLDELERIVSARDIGDDVSLAATDDGRALGELFGTTQSAPLAAAIIPDVDPAATAAPADVDAGVVSLGQGIKLTLVDEDPVVLDEISRTVDQGVSMARATAEEEYRRDDFFGLSGQLSAIYFYHTIEGLLAQVEPERTETSLTYEVRLDDDVSWHSAVTTMGLLWATLL